MSLVNLYMGNPLSPFGMQALTLPPPGTNSPGASASTAAVSGVNALVSRATVAQSLISGGVAIQRKPKTKSSYSIGWSLLGMTDVDLLMSFFDGRQGGGPYCLVDPSWNNFFPPNVAGMGAVIGALPEWSPTAGTLAVSATAGNGSLSGTATWTTGVTGSILYAGLNNVVDGTWLPPVVNGAAVRASIYAKLVSGTGSLTAAAMYGLGGSAPAGTAATGTTVTLSTGSWQEVFVNVANNFSWPAATADYVLPKWTISSAATPVILFTAPSFVYDQQLNTPGVASGAVPSVLSPWVGGVGVPRVVIVGDVPTPVDLIGLREYALTLQEA